ncbi:hypothetical protein GCM10023196_035610 [Actinoallomurus vinaceus]|uniref:Uncharacterized protein n=1 Tax=Actinoallomurus vinaceus TaxID=1080074 RepID=A0ABP8U8V2_9ACTN
MTATGAVALTGSNQAVSATPAFYAGFSIRETAGSTAVVRIWDNPSAASGTVLEEIGFAANESAREYYPGGVWATKGIYVQVVSGTVAGSVRIG